MYYFYSDSYNWKYIKYECVNVWKGKLALMQSSTFVHLSSHMTNTKTE